MTYRLHPICWCLQHPDGIELPVVYEPHELRTTQKALKVLLGKENCYLISLLHG